MNVIVISMNRWALAYLKESFNKIPSNKITLITDKLSKDLEIYLKEKKIKHLVTSKLTIKNLNHLDLKNGLFISAGSPWVFSKEIIKKFGKHFYNVHQSPLPSMRGSVSSYIILYDIRAFQTCLHKVEPGIDTGNVVYRKSFIIPSSLKLPNEIFIQ